MMAMALLGLGAAGVLASLKTVTLGASGVRDFDVATTLAQTWADRMRTDAAAWTSATTFGGATLLAAGEGGTVFLPEQTYGSVTLRAGADVQGGDAVPNAAGARFCSALRYRCLNLPAGTLDTPSARCPMIIASVAVYWPREGATAAPAQFCTSAIAGAALPLDGVDREQAFDEVYRTVTISTVLTPTLP